MVIYFFFLFVLHFCCSNILETGPEFPKFFLNPAKYLEEAVVSTLLMSKAENYPDKSALNEGYDFDFKPLEGGGQSLILKKNSIGTRIGYWLDTREEIIIDPDGDLKFVFTSGLTGCSIYANFLKDENGVEKLYIFHQFIDNYDGNIFPDKIKEERYGPGSGAFSLKFSEYNRNMYALRPGLWMQSVTAMLYRDEGCNWNMLYQVFHYLVDMDMDNSIPKYFHKVDFQQKPIPRNYKKILTRNEMQCCKSCQSTTTSTTTTERTSTPEKSSTTTRSITSTRKPEDGNNSVGEGNDGIGGGGGIGGGIGGGVGIGGGGGIGGGDNEGNGGRENTTTFKTTNTPTTILKSTTFSPSTTKNTTTYAPTWGYGCAYNFYKGYDITPGIHLKKVFGTVSECCSFCKETFGCVAWSHNVSPQACYLKSSSKVIYKGGTVSSGILKAYDVSCRIPLGFSFKSDCNTVTCNCPKVANVEPFCISTMLGCLGHKDTVDTWTQKRQTGKKYCC